MFSDGYLCRLFLKKEDYVLLEVKACELKKMPESYGPMETIFNFFFRLSEKPSFEFVLKTDDDCYIDVERILSELERHGGTGKLWWGRCVQWLLVSSSSMLIFILLFLLYAGGNDTVFC